MDASPMTYAEHEPSPAVGGRVAGYWTFAIDAGATPLEPLGAPPDGCVALTWRLGHGQLFVTGAHTGWRSIIAQPGDRMFGIRFWPGAATTLLPLDPAPLRERVLPAEQFPGLKKFEAMTRALDRAADDADAIAIADRHLAVLCANAPQPDAAVMRTTARVVESAGKCTVAELADAESLSPRQLRRRFLAAAGLPPQEFIRVWRWRCCAVGMGTEDSTDWTTLAAEYGYADQPHLVREFRHAIGLTPKNYLRLISRVDYSRLRLTRGLPRP
jgi:AraC-like DNA-binding protein